MLIYYNKLLTNMLLCDIVKGSLYALEGCQETKQVHIDSFFLLK
jgi:hypothetical protein